ncbi:MAG: hypothetical protein VX805_02975 [Pseudomonadota bacterium]|nr:hypothetical protein [Pseudomonadota bacterium]|tara:strand:+ start:355 stop:528 length:174 start_codon:yes stop_codon:yes gene_type:complete
MTELKEYRLVASRVTNYVAYVEAYDQIEAESISRSSTLDWQFIDDDDYEVYSIEEVE